MLSNAFKLVALAMTFICVAARPPKFEEFPQATEEDEMNVKVPETENDEADNVEMDGMSKRQTKPVIPVPKPCPFDCNSIAIVEDQSSGGISGFLDPQIYKCCQNACSQYQSWLNSNQPPWACYRKTLDIMCKCTKVNSS
jgi:hypothetical protein